jgi:hypothetical protein
MDFLLTWFAVYITLGFFLDEDETLWPALIIAIILSGLGELDSEEKADTAEGEPTIVTEEKVNSAPQKNITKEILEDETRVEWENSDTKWNYHKGQTWETQKNF